MSTPTVSKLLLTSILTLALSATPIPAFAKHHGGGSRGGSHGGGSHGSSHSRGSGGFHFGGGHSSGKSFRSGRSAAPRQMGGDSFRRSSVWSPRANRNSAVLGGLRNYSNSQRSTSGVARRSIGSPIGRTFATGTHTPGMSFDSNRPPNAAWTSRGWSRPVQSSWAGAPRSTSSFNSDRPPSAASPSRGWSSQGQSSWAGTSRLATSFNSNRPPSAASPSRGWSGQGPSSWVSTPRSASSFNSNRPPSAASPLRNWSGQNQFSWKNVSRSAPTFEQHRRRSSFENSRFGHSGIGHSSSSHSRAWSSAHRHGNSQFDGAHPFDWGAASFNRETSYGGSDFSFFPDLFGLALDLGGFGLRSLSLLGSGLNAFGPLGINLLGSALANSNSDLGMDSPQWGPGPAFYPTGNLACPR